MLEKGNATSNPTLLNIELMDSTTCLDVDVPGGDRLEVFIGWYILSHHRVGAKSLGRPSGKANHPMKPEQFGLAMWLRSDVPGRWADRKTVGIEYGLAWWWSRRARK